MPYSSCVNACHGTREYASLHKCMDVDQDRSVGRQVSVLRPMNPSGRACHVPVSECLLMVRLCAYAWSYLYAHSRTRTHQQRVYVGSILGLAALPKKNNHTPVDGYVGAYDILTWMQVLADIHTRRGMSEYAFECAYQALMLGVQRRHTYIRTAVMPVSQASCVPGYVPTYLHTETQTQIQPQQTKCSRHFP
jgi:hypothetical protein